MALNGYGAANGGLTSSNLAAAAQYAVTGRCKPGKTGSPGFDALKKRSLN